MALDAKIFFEVIKKHDLVTDKQFQALQTAVQKESVSESDLEVLVAKKYLTRWQAARLKSGKHNFSVGEFRLLDFLGKDRYGEVYVVRPKGSRTQRRLRLVAKEVSEDAAKLESFLQRAKAFFQIKTEGLVRVLQVAQVGSRYIVVSQLPAGIPLAKHCEQPLEVDQVRSLVDAVASVTALLREAGVQHGTLDEHAIFWNEPAKWLVDLPSDIGFSPNGSRPIALAETSDESCLAKVAAGCLIGDFSQPPTSDHELAEGLYQLAAQRDVAVTDILKKLGSTEFLSPEDLVVSPDQVPPADGTIQIPDIADLADDQPEPADELASIDQRDDMFGDFDKIEVASEISATPPPSPQVPIIVEDSNQDSRSAVFRARPKSKKTRHKDQDGQAKDAESSEVSPASGKKILLYAAAGGGVGVVVLGLLIFFLTRGDGSNSNRQVAAKTPAVASDSESSQTSPNEDSDPGNEDSDSTPATGDQGNPEPKSSGAFKGIGAFNREQAMIQNPSTDEDDANPAGDEQVLDVADPAADETTSSADPASGTTSTGDETPGAGQVGNESEAQGEPINDQDLLGRAPADQTTNEPGATPGEAADSKDDPANKNDAAKGDSAKEEPAKEEPDEGPVLLIGKSKDKDKAGKAEAESAAFPDPFSQAPDFVDLTPPTKTDDVTAFQTLFPCRVPAGLTLNVTLHGGEHAAKSNVQFELKASTSEDSTWIVSAGAKAPLKPIARFKLDGSNFGFAWEPEAADFSNAIYLANCALRIQAAKYRHVLALRSPLVSEPLDFADSFSPKGDAMLNNLPDMDYVKVSLVNLPPEFPGFKYLDDKNVLTGRTDSLGMAFQKDNIDLARGVLSCRLRGSRMSIGAELNYVTPDKQLQKLVSLERFENDAGKFLAEADLMEARLAKLNEEYNKLPTPAQKGQFTKATGRNDLQEKVNVARDYKGHIQNSLEVLKKIAQHKVAYRIYYQAGEVEVDLATPDGKRYSAPSPPPAQAPAAPK